VKLFNEEHLIPLHSITAFLAGILVTWDFNLFPSFVLFSIGWILVACNEHVNKNPSPWHQCPRYDLSIAARLLSGRVGRGAVEISPNQDLDKIEAYNKDIERRDRRRQKERELEAEQQERLVQELGDGAELAEEEENIATKKGGILKSFSVNPLKPVLHPIQLQLRQAGRSFYRDSQCRRCLQSFVRRSATGLNVIFIFLRRKQYFTVEWRRASFCGTSRSSRSG